MPCINHLSKYAEDKLFQYRARFNGTIISFHLSRLLKSGSFSFPSTLSFSTLFFRFSSSSFLTDLRGFRPLGYYIPRGKVHESNKRLDTGSSSCIRKLAPDSSSRSTPKERSSRNGTFLSTFGRGISFLTVDAICPRDVETKTYYGKYRNQEVRRVDKRTAEFFATVARETVEDHTLRVLYKMFGNFIATVTRHCYYDYIARI